MTPNLQRKRRICIYLSSIAAIISLVVLIVVLWVLQARGTFSSIDERKRNVTATDNEDQVQERTFSEPSNDSIADVNGKHDNNLNVQFVTPLKISPQPLHHHDLLYDQMHNETTKGPPSSKHGSGHFRHKTAEIWDPHPEYEIEAFGKKLHLTLVHNDDVPKNIHITHIYGNYSRRIEHDPRVSGCYYKGSIKGDVNSSVSVNLCHGMTGHIHTSTGNYYITPVENTSQDSVSAIKHKIIKEPYRPDDSVYGENSNISHCEEKIIIDDDFLPDSETTHDRTKREILFFDEIESFDYPQYDLEFEENKRSARGIHHQHRYGKSARRKRTDREYFIEVLVVADKQMAAYHKDRETLIQYILTLMSHVGILFKDATVGNPITLVVVHISILNNTEFSANRSDEMLRNFCEWQSQHNGHIHHDAAILLTRNVICKNLTSGICHTLGIAEVGGMCSETSSCSIVKDNGLSTSYTIAHEMGHLLNMRHDDFHACAKYNGNSNANIMSKVLHNETKPWQWSACSRHYLTEFLDSPRASCLLGKPKDVKLEFSNTLPGENFEVNRQCELEFGADSKICSFMPKCRSLWCTSEAGEENGCRSQHMPWADGTRCDYRSWCHHGKCIAMDREALAPRNGIWGPWGPWGECSRTCGGGIQMSKRECNQPPPANGGSYCTGQSTMFMSCNIQECPPGTPDFREVQCSEFDGNTKGITGLTPNVKWIPKYGITEEHDLCQLFCRVKGANEYYRLRDKVRDGTKCSINSFDICVKGKCLPGGCDNKLNSTQTLDECSICNGDNSTCQEVHGTYNHSTRGYSRVVRIPRGSSNLVIEQHGHYGPVRDDNYLALVDGETGEYILNGKFIISHEKRDMIYGGLTVSYTGAKTQLERVTTPKNRKLTKDLILEVLTVTGMPPDINYRYTINKEMAPKFGWHLFEGNWTECNSICRGVQYMQPLCLDLINYAQVPESRCSDVPMSGFAREKACNMHCKLAWNITKSGECSVHCGHGWQDVNYNCIKVNLMSNEHVHHQLEYAVDDKHCSNLPMPSPMEPCKGPCDSTHWQYTPWNQCSQTCGTGTRSRTAKCVDIRNNTIEDFHCHTRRKIIQQPCSIGKCPTWEYGNWTSCSAICGKGHRTQKYYCSINGQVINEEKCNRNDLKIPREECEEKPCKWYVSNWTLCSVSCGEGIKIREVECRAGSMKVHENFCRGYLKPNKKNNCTKTPCEIVQDDRVYDNEIPNDIHYYQRYDFSWDVGRWSECSKSCGGGTKSRAVVCRDRHAREHDAYCDRDKKPARNSKCNEFECPYWRMGNWTSCNVFCERSRLVKCSNQTGSVPLCDETMKPKHTEKCKPEDCHRGRPTPLPTEVKKIQRFRWRKTAWGPCSNFCGKGTRTRKVTCRDTLGNVTVVDGFCHGQVKPKHTRFCQHYSKVNCSFTWVDGPWSKCSKSCGIGYRYRNVTCQRVFLGGVIQEGVATSYHKCDFSTRPLDKESCTERSCTDPYMWRTDSWSKCPETCGMKGFQVRRLHCTNQRGQRFAKKFCRKLKRPERKKRCPVIYCSNCKEIQLRMKSKENREYILKLHGKLAPVYCYKMDTKEPEEFISLQGGKDNYAQFYDRRSEMLSQTSFWKVRLDIKRMQIISHDFTFSKANGTQQYYAQAGTDYPALKRYIYFVIDMTDTTFRLADSVRWICTQRDDDGKRVDIRNGQYVSGMCAPSCRTCQPDPNYGLPVEIT